MDIMFVTLAAAFLGVGVGVGLLLDSVLHARRTRKAQALMPIIGVVLPNEEKN
jgi:hypothetical protein